MEQAKATDVKVVELTRREWLLKLGEAAVMLGCSGPMLETTGHAATQIPANAAQLPPGLYEASSDHLSHALTADSPFVRIPPGSETDYVRPPNGPFQPQFFAAEEFRTIRRIVELMLGEATGSSGARGAEKANHDNHDISGAVAEWIDLSLLSAGPVREAARGLAPEHRILAVAYYGAEAVRALEERDPQQVCRDGLRWIKEESEHLSGAPFLRLKEAQQTQILERISDHAQNRTPENAGTRLFHLIKSEVTRGFYTSQAGLKELDYKGNAFYAESPGCVRHKH
jgi:hypothetical protein